jgi:hypothetical protein
MAHHLLTDKFQLAAIALTIITGIYGIKKLRRLSLRNMGSLLTDEQSDLLVIGLFHIIICMACTVSICCML